MNRFRVAAIVGLLLLLAGMAFATFSSSRIFLPALLKGLVVTLQVSALSILVFLFMSVVAGVARSSPVAPIRWLAALYVETFRGTALLVQLFWLFFVLPEFGISLSPIVAGVLGIGLNYGAYGSEVVRGAISAVPKGQLDACTALNMPPLKRMARIVFPQAFLIMLPGMGNLTIELIKATSVVSAVTLVDLTNATVLENNIHLRTLELFSITMLIYYCLSQTVRFSLSMLEEWSSAYRPKRT